MTPSVEFLFLLGLFGVFFLYTGMASLASPIQFARKLGLSPNGRSGEIEIRAQYGGFFFSAGILQFASVFGVISIFDGFLVSVVIFGGLFFGRLIAFFIKRRNEPLIPLIRLLYFIDGAGFILATYGLARAV